MIGMKTLITTLVFLFTSTSFAQKAHVTILDPNIDGKPLEGHFNVHRGSTYKKSLPSRELRDEVLSGVPKIQNWEELKKDILFMDLESKSIKELHKKYPELSEKELKGLKDRR
jgi:hypothetical protein